MEVILHGDHARQERPLGHGVHPGFVFHLKHGLVAVPVDLLYVVAIIHIIERFHKNRVSFPALIIAVAVIGILGNGLQNIAIAVIVSMWAWFARTVRAYALVEMGKDYILAARISGCGTAKLIVKHLIPSILPQFFVYLSTCVASSIPMVSSFAFLGLGLPVGVAEWGAMLNDARTNLYSHPEFPIYPGLCILITAAGFNLFGEALRDVLLPEEEGF
jgi:peptide/nickel transport system permease protein